MRNPPRTSTSILEQRGPADTYRNSLPPQAAKTDAHTPIPLHFATRRIRGHSRTSSFYRAAGGPAFGAASWTRTQVIAADTLPCCRAPAPPARAPVRPHARLSDSTHQPPQPQYATFNFLSEFSAPVFYPE